MGSICLIIASAILIGGLLTAFCFGLFSHSEEQETTACREDCGVCPEQGSCAAEELRSVPR